MNISNYVIKYKVLMLLLVCLTIHKAHSNINAIDFTKVGYPLLLQSQVDFLRNNDGIYNHWVHDWSADIAKDKVLGNLTELYNGLDKLPVKNAETYLLLGDVAHYLYNMEVEEYYQKAVDNYKQAKTLAPKDYRVYWFLANHYALSAKAILSIDTYKIALQYLPSPNVHAMFWADYSVACANARMLGTAKYAAHQTSILEGQTSYVEKELIPVLEARLKSAPLDTTIASNDMWSIYSREGNKLILKNWVLGAKLTVDSNWSLDAGDYKNRVAYIVLKPNEATAKNGQKIGYSILVLAKIPAANESLKQFLDKFTKDYKIKQRASFNVGNIKNGLAYEIYEPGMYTNIGGGHLYAIAIERDVPEYPGMAIETPAEIPKDNKNTSGPVYYNVPQEYVHLRSKLYYYICLDSCEYINAESLAVFKDFLANGIVIE